MPTTPRLDSIEGHLGHRFRDPGLLLRALTHPSYSTDHPSEENNQRLEFLGDAVLQLVTAEALYTRYPAAREGLLSKRRAVLVNRAMLARLAREAGLDRALRFGKSEARGRPQELPSALSDALEAVLGAVLQDADFATARACALRLFGDLDARLGGTEEEDNPKGRLQEFVQPLHGNTALRYELVGTTGADHAREYEVVVLLLDKRLGTGRGPSKKTAESEAARAALAALQKRG
jgi:ribonuclease III